MIGGLSRTGRLAVAAIFCAVGGAPGMEERAEAADLGGDCCADLEERVAELEATTVRKGNKKVKVQLYGQVNRVVNFWDDGAEQNVYVLNNSYSSTRFGMNGKAKITDNWHSGFQIEIEDEGNLSKFVDQFNDNPDNGSLNVRKSAIYVESEKLGKIWLGQQETAKDNITKDTIVIKGLDKTMHADFYMNWSFFLRQKGFCGQLPALKDNRAEVEKLQSVEPREDANGVPVTKYRPGLYFAMDWVAARLHKAGAPLWPLVLDGEEVECLSLLSLCMG